MSKKYGIPVSTFVHYTAPSRYLHQAKLYNTRYVRTKRRLHDLFPKVFNGDVELSLRDVARRIDGKTGVLFKERCLEDILGKYKGNKGCAPLVKAETGNYCLNPTFYNN